MPYKLAPHIPLGNPGSRAGTQIRLLRLRHGPCTAFGMRQINSHAAIQLIDTLAYRFVLASISGFALFSLLTLLYLSKSALGIDLMDGPSPFHGLFFG